MVEKQEYARSALICDSRDNYCEVPRGRRIGPGRLTWSASEVQRLDRIHDILVKLSVARDGASLRKSSDLARGIRV